MKTIILHGFLKDLHPGPIEVHADTPAEAITALQQLPGFSFDTPPDVRIDGIECRDALFLPTSMTELHVFPALCGAGGNGGFFQILLGAVMVVVGALLWWTGPAGGSLATAGISMMLGGGMMMLGGIIQLLAPQPSFSSSTSKSSLILPSNQNTVKVGTRMPLIFGRHKFFGHYLSFNVDALSYDENDFVIGGYCNQSGSGQVQNCVIA